MITNHFEKMRGVEHLNVNETIIRQLREIVGKEHVLTSDLDRFGYSYDSSPVP